MDDVSAAKIIIKCLDLTSLNPDDTEDEIIDLCRRLHLSEIRSPGQKPVDGHRHQNRNCR